MGAEIQPPSFSYLEALRRAESTLANPPARAHIRRAIPAGEVIQEFAVPLELCPTLNVFAEMPKWKRARTKETLGLLMLQQNGRREPKPLPGRPQLIAIRFSTQEPDRDSAWCKFPTDRLTVKGGLGYLVDDKPSALDLFHWWEPCKRGEGFVFLQLRTGEEHA